MNKKRMIIIVLVGLCLAVAAYFFFKPHKTTAPEEPQGKIEVPPQPKEKPKETTKDEYGLLYERTEIPSMNVSLMLPKGWEMRYDNTGICYLTAPKKGEWENIQIALLGKYMENCYPEESYFAFLPNLRLQLHYDAVGETLYPQEFEEYPEMYSANEDMTKEVWAVRDAGIYAEYPLDQKPSLAGAMIEKGYHLISYSYPNQRRFIGKSDGESGGSRGQFWHNLHFVPKGHTMLMISVVSPTAKDLQGEALAELLAESVKTSEEMPPRTPEFVEAPKTDKIPYRIPVGFEVSKKGDDFCAFIDRKTGLQAVVIDFVSSSEAVIPQDLQDERILGNLLRGLTHVEDRLVDQMVHRDITSLQISPGKTREEGHTRYLGYTDILLLNDKGVIGGLSGVGFPVKGYFYLSQEGLRTRGLFIPSSEKTMKMAELIGNQWIKQIAP